MNCRSCQAPSDGTTLTCAYCGAVLGNISGAADEMRAVDEILQLLQRTAESDKTTLDGDSKVATLIPVIWIPHTPEPKLRLAVALSGFGSDASGDAYGRKIADVALTKADAIARQLQIELAGDARVGALDAAIQRRRRLQAGSSVLNTIKNSRGIKQTLGGTFMLFISLGAMKWAFNSDSRENQERDDRREAERRVESERQHARDEIEHSEGICRGTYNGDQLIACQEVCEAGRRWACVAVARLRGSPTPQANSPSASDDCDTPRGDETFEAYRARCNGDGSRGSAVPPIPPNVMDQLRRRIQQSNHNP